MNIAIIPARGGSKRIPRKNIKEFCGKPMIAWSIEAALKSGCFDQVIVSTDDEDIATVSRRYGAETPFMRPSVLADDYTGTSAVVRHAIQWLIDQGQTPDQVCCIYATAPFVLPEDLQQTLEIIVNTGASYVFSATSFPFPIQRAIKKTAQEGCTPMFPEYIGKRSQDLEEAFHDAGQFYWGRSESWLNGSSIFTPSSRMYLLPRWRVQDVDTLDDWNKAEKLFKAFYVNS